MLEKNNNITSYHFFGHLKRTYESEARESYVYSDFQVSPRSSERGDGE